MSWECPECKFKNDNGLIRCICGYEISDTDVKSEVETDDFYEKAEIVIRSDYQSHEVRKILIDLVETPPTSLKTLWYGQDYNLYGVSPVCGTINDLEFTLHNRSDWRGSAVVYGKIGSSAIGTEIYIRTLKKNRFVNFIRQLLYGISQEHDLKTIISFLRDLLEN
jgi:hypothetical protein